MANPANAGRQRTKSDAFSVGLIPAHWPDATARSAMSCLLCGLGVLGDLCVNARLRAPGAGPSDWSTPIARQPGERQKVCVFRHGRNISGRLPRGSSGHPFDARGTETWFSCRNVRHGHASRAGPTSMCWSQREDGRVKPGHDGGVSAYRRTGVSAYRFVQVLMRAMTAFIRSSCRHRSTDCKRS
jgi:hypothetical protein